MNQTNIVMPFTNQHGIYWLIDRRPTGKDIDIVENPSFLKKIFYPKYLFGIGWKVFELGSGIAWSYKIHKDILGQQTTDINEISEVIPLLKKAITNPELLTIIHTSPVKYWELSDEDRTLYNILYSLFIIKEMYPNLDEKQKNSIGIMVESKIPNDYFLYLYSQYHLNGRPAFEQYIIDIDHVLYEITFLNNNTFNTHDIIFKPLGITINNKWLSFTHILNNTKLSKHSGYIKDELDFTEAKEKMKQLFNNLQTKIKEDTLDKLSGLIETNGQIVPGKTTVKDVFEKLNVALTAKMNKENITNEAQQLTEKDTEDIMNSLKNKW